MARFYVFSDESGSWHDPSEVYVRSWIVIPESIYENFFINKIDELASVIDANELKWSNVCGGLLESFLNDFTQIPFKVFITVTRPGDIDWNEKYVLTRNFEESFRAFNFGGIDDVIKEYLKERYYKEAKNALFLNYYERLHIQNAKEGIERAIIGEGHEFIYRIDPPQHPRREWQAILENLTQEETDFEFSNSIRSQGIQFADVFAGAFKSFFKEDNNLLSAERFIRNFRPKLISRNSQNPNPNLIMFGETHNDIKSRCSRVWTI